MILDKRAKSMSGSCTFRSYSALLGRPRAMFENISTIFIFVHSDDFLCWHFVAVFFMLSI